MPLPTAVPESANELLVNGRDSAERQKKRSPLRLGLTEKVLSLKAYSTATLWLKTNI